MEAPKPESHALLSASGANRWIHCPGSAILESLEQDRETEFTEEGTKAHAEAAMAIQKAIESGKEPGDLSYDVRSYVDYVLGKTRKKTDGETIMVETKVDFGDAVPNGFGTSDAIIYGDGLLEVVDLKYGKGVEVSPVENPQLMLYAWGAYRFSEGLYDFSKIRMTIVQPRVGDGKPKSWDMTLDGLRKAISKIGAKALEAASGKGSLIPGPWCGFCKAKAKCPAQMALFDRTEAEAIARKEEMTIPQMAEAAKRFDAVEKFIKAVKDRLAAELMAGKEVPGWKLVAGRATRKVADPKGLWDWAASNSVPIQSVMEPAGVTKIEKAVGKAKAAELESLGIIAKSQGKPALVPADDPRAEWEGEDGEAFESAIGRKK